MQITALVTAMVAAASTVSAATHINFIQRNGGGNNAIWTTAGGAEHGLILPGQCMDWPIPGVRDLCWDWGNKRAHFTQDNGVKRCLRQWNERFIGSCAGGVCTIYQYNEVACNW